MPQDPDSSAPVGTPQWLVLDPTIEGEDLRQRVAALVRAAVGGRADAASLVVSVVRDHDRGRRTRWLVTVHNLDHGDVPGAGALIEHALDALDAG